MRSIFVSAGQHGFLASLGDGDHRGPKLDLGGFLILVPLGIVYVVYHAFDRMLPLEYREMASNLFALVVLVVVCLVLQWAYQPSRRQLGVDIITLKSARTLQWTLIAIGFSTVRHVLPLFASEVSLRSPQLLFAGQVNAGFITPYVNAAVEELFGPVAEELLFRGYVYLEVISKPCTRG